jgi:hypothetical protein
MLTTHENVTHQLNDELRQIDERLATYGRSLIGAPYVVQLFPGLYLVPCAEGYRAAGITDGVMMYSAEGAARAIEHCRTAYPRAFYECRIMHMNDALRDERAAVVALLEMMEGAAA